MTSRALNMLAKAVMKKVIDSLGRQTAQVEVTKGELIDDVERMQDYGFSSNPPASGTDALIAFLGGSRDQGVIVRMENRSFRLKNLKSGEVAMFDDLGNVFKLGREQVEVIGVTKLVASAPQIELVATSSAKVTCGASSMTITPAGIALNSPVLTHNGKNIGATHAHTGVTSGSGTTGAPV